MSAEKELTQVINYTGGTEERKFSRRDFLKDAGAGLVGLAGGLGVASIPRSAKAQEAQELTARVLTWGDWKDYKSGKFVEDWGKDPNHYAFDISPNEIYGYLIHLNKKNPEYNHRLPNYEEAVQIASHPQIESILFGRGRDPFFLMYYGCGVKDEGSEQIVRSSCGLDLRNGRDFISISPEKSHNTTAIVIVAEKKKDYIELKR